MTVTPDSHNLSYIDWSEAEHLDNWDSVEEKIRQKHHVTKKDVEVALSGRDAPVYEEKGEKAGEYNGYIRKNYGMHEHKKMFVVVIVEEPSGRGVLLTARTMDDDEFNFYQSQL